MSTSEVDGIRLLAAGTGREVLPAGVGRLRRGFSEYFSSLSDWVGLAGAWSSEACTAMDLTRRVPCRLERGDGVAVRGARRATELRGEGWSADMGEWRGCERDERTPERRGCVREGRSGVKWAGGCAFEPD